MPSTLYISSRVLLCPSRYFVPQEDERNTALSAVDECEGISSFYNDVMNDIFTHESIYLHFSIYLSQTFLYKIKPPALLINIWLYIAYLNRVKDNKTMFRQY